MILKANFYSLFCWYKNNKWLLISILIWPYLMSFVILAMGILYGNLESFKERLNIANPVLYILATSAIAMSSVGIIDAVASFTIYHRWIGTLPYLVLAPVKTYKILLFSSIPESIISITLSIVAVIPAVMYFEGLLGIAKIIMVLLIVYMGMAPLLGLSILIASFALGVRGEENIASSLSPFILMISGVFYPIEVLPRVLQYVSTVMPTRYVIEATKILATYAIPEAKLLFTILYLLAILTIGYNSISALTLKSIEKWARRRGGI